MLHPYLQSIQDAIPRTWPDADRQMLAEHLQRLNRNHERTLSSNEAPPSAEAQELLAEIDRVFGDVGALNESVLLLHANLPCEASTRIRSFLTQHEIAYDWREIPPTMVGIAFPLLESPEALRSMLPAYLKGHCLYPDSINTFFLLSTDEEGAEEESELYSLLNEEQRSLVERIVNRQRQKGSLSDINALLPWEMVLYLDQDEYTRPAAWLRHHYADLSLPELVADERISRLRAAIPEDWDKAAREELESFLDEKEQALAEFRQREKEERLEINEQSASLILDIHRAFEGVSDEGERLLLLAGGGMDENLSDEALDLLSGFEHRGDWRDIPHEWLYACDNALHLANAVGFRYLVPAFLCAELQSNLSTDMISVLGSKVFETESLHEHYLEQVSLFTPEQRAVLVDYMNYHHRSIKSVAVEMGMLLPWEMSDYLAHRDSYESTREWLLAHSPEPRQDA